MSEYAGYRVQLIDVVAKNKASGCYASLFGTLDAPFQVEVFVDASALEPEVVQH